jgi:hypothetical protein
VPPMMFVSRNAIGIDSLDYVSTDSPTVFLSMCCNRLLFSFGCVRTLHTTSTVTKYNKNKSVSVSDVKKSEKGWPEGRECKNWSPLSNAFFFYDKKGIPLDA